MKSPLDRFNEKVDKTSNDCWEWLACLSQSGYGRIQVDGKCPDAYKFAYEQFIGPVPDGLHLDHRCDNKKCVNPWHLKAVPPKENILRGTCPAAMNAVKIECVNGHTFTPENTYIRPNGNRTCKRCNLDAKRRYRERKRDR